MDNILKSILKHILFAFVLCFALRANLLAAYAGAEEVIKPFSDNELKQEEKPAEINVFNAKRRHMESLLDVDAIYKNILVEGVNVGGLTIEEAKKRVRNALAASAAAIEITLICERCAADARAVDFGLAYEIDEAIDRAYDYARKGKLEDRFNLYKMLEDNPINIPASFSFDLEKVAAFTDEICAEYYVEPKEPGFSRSNGQFIVTKEVVGREVVKNELYNILTSFIMTKRSGSLEIPVVYINPRFTAEELYKATSLLGSYETAFRDTDYNRTANLLLAASRINNVVVMPGEEFSTNRALNPEPMSDNGYLKASAYLQGKVVDSIGGGICQVASTLYMALLYSELEITQRQNHSMGVAYTDFACDATLVDNLIDLKFKNNTGYPVTIESFAKDLKIYVNIYGAENRPGNRFIKFENALLETVQPPAELVTYDKELPLNKRVVEVMAKPGYKYKLYKLVYVDGELTDRVVVNTSTYKVVRGRVRIGSGGY